MPSAQSDSGKGQKACFFFFFFVTKTASENYQV